MVKFMSLMQILLSATAFNASDDIHGQVEKSLTAMPASTNTSSIEPRIMWTAYNASNNSTNIGLATYGDVPTVAPVKLIKFQRAARSSSHSSYHSSSHSTTHSSTYSSPSSVHSGYSSYHASSPNTPTWNSPNQPTGKTYYEKSGYESSASVPSSSLNAPTAYQASPTTTTTTKRNPAAWYYLPWHHHTQQNRTVNDNVSAGDTSNNNVRPSTNHIKSSASPTFNDWRSVAIFSWLLSLTLTLS
jgi:hypothetical protein